MPLNLFEKICLSHNMEKDGMLDILPDQVLIHDALGTPVCLQLEAAGITSVKPLLAIYCDHNTLQVGYRNDDDHVYLQGMAKRLGACFFRPATASATRPIWKPSPSPAACFSAPTAIRRPAAAWACWP